MPSSSNEFAADVNVPMFCFAENRTIDLAVERHWPRVRCRIEVAGLGGRRAFSE